ncbi:MAG: hypothetical protein KAK00_10350 [Nanoarchaeota archaeon]|nr:hypothetical protein [Nanoarchaeota archaeon]
MEELIKKDILAVLKSTFDILQQPEPDTTSLKQLSNKTIHNASIFQDEHSVSVAILIYSLSKIIERVRSKFDYSKIKNLIEISIEYLEDDNLESYHEFITQIFSIISKTDTKFKLYVREVINQASIKKGSVIHEHGVSASKTAQILGISLWDLHEYLGATNTPDIDTDISSVRERLKFTRTLFS